jgi:hypothetical protein
MSNIGDGRRKSSTGRSPTMDVNVRSDDRIHPLPAEDDTSSGRSWATLVLIFCAYFAPAAAVALPFSSPNGGLIAAAAAGLGSAGFAFFFLDRSEPHRRRLLIMGGGIAAVFFYFVAKQWLKI